ncbi:MAG: hypothetical protein GY786_13555 [Proteobacteria bacterium]|nr:hypothetical protein [Pseudomonadota bacterium]
MFQVIFKILNSKLLKFFVKVIGSLASAMIVISGYLAIVDQSSKKKEFENEIDDPNDVDEINLDPEKEE